MTIRDLPHSPAGNYRKHWSLLALIGCCAGLGCNSSTSNLGASLRTVTFLSASTQQWVKQSSVGTSSVGTAVNDFTTNIALSSQANNVTALGRAVPNPLPGTPDNAGLLPEQEFLASYDANGNDVSSTPIGQGIVLAAPTAVAAGTPDGNYAAAASNSVTTGNSPTLVPLNIEKFSPAGSAIWTAALPTTSQFSQFRPDAIAADETGDVYVAGAVATSSGELWGIFFAKFDGNSGTVVWQDEYPSNTERVVNNITTDANGNLYVVGAGSSKLASQTTPFNGTSSFLAKVDSATGKTIWSVSAPSGISFLGAAVNSAGNGYIVGKFGMKQQIGYLAGFSTQSGALTWQEQLGGDTLLPSNISVDASGNAVFVGAVRGVAQDVFLAKIGSDGHAIWLQTFGTGQEEHGVDIDTSPAPFVATDSQNNIYVAGITGGAFPGFQNPSGLGEAFVAKFAGQ